MERSERIRLESLRSSLKKNLAGVEALLATANAPRTQSKAERRARAEAIARAVRAKGGSVDPEQLRAICKKTGMPFTAVGALFGGGYLDKKTSNGRERVFLGSRGRRLKGRPAPPKKRKK